MTVVTLPKKHQEHSRLRIAMRGLYASLEIQAEAISEFRETMSELDQRIQKIDGSVKKFDSNLNNIQKNCAITRTLMPEALACGNA
jgi:hypothetical protein